MTDLHSNSETKIVYGYYRTITKCKKKVLRSKWFRVSPKGDTPDRVFALLETVFRTLPNVELDICLEPKPAKDVVF